jgi:hypothetical protein
MKKFFTILTVVALTTTTSFAQFTVKAGLNMANFVSNSDDVENEIKLGMVIGGSYDLELSDAMNLDISAAFKQSGTKQTSEEVNGDVTSKSSFLVSLNYLDFSPSLSFDLTDAVALSVGPYFAYAMSGKVKSEWSISGGGLNESSSETESINFGDGENDDGIKAMDFGLNIGASYSINDAMSLSAGYALGLTNLIYIDDELKELYDSINEDLPNIKNSGIFLSFGYTLGH